MRFHSLIMTGLLVVPCLSLADEITPELSHVIYQAQATEWISTDTAKITMGVDATLQQNEVEKFHQNLIPELEKVAPKTEWHITQFQRNETGSGLEHVIVQAEARLPNDQLADIRGKAKEITKPGVTYQIINIDYSPSQADIEKARAILRNDIYQQVVQELKQLNQTYPDQHFFVGNIDFTAPMPSPLPTNMMMVTGAARDQASAPVPVSNQLMMQARVDLTAKSPQNK